MSEYGQNQNNPSGIWQHIWVTLKMQALEELHAKKYLAAWDTIQSLVDELPPDCQTDCLKMCRQIEEIVKVNPHGYSSNNVLQNRLKHIETNLPKPLRDLMREITASLFRNGWINKNFGAKPKFSGGGTL